MTLITRRARDRRAQLKGSVRSSTRTRMANQDQADEDSSRGLTGVTAMLLIEIHVWVSCIEVF